MALNKWEAKPCLYNHVNTVCDLITRSNSWNMCLTFLFFKKFSSFNRWAIHDSILFRSIKVHKYIHIGNSAVIKISNIGSNLQVSYLGPGILPNRNNGETTEIFKKSCWFKNHSTEIFHNAFKYLGAMILSRSDNIKYLKSFLLYRGKLRQKTEKEYNVASLIGFKTSGSYK